MDRVMLVDQVLAQEVAWYSAANGHKTRLYHFADHDQQLYGAFSIPDKDHPTLKRPRFIVLAQVIEEAVIIEEDISDHPLVDRLLAAGIPRQQIILGYAGESNSGRG